MALERIDPRDFSGDPISLDHLARYAFAAQFARGRRVLDVACGLGYGSHLLRAAGAEAVRGIDISEDAVRAARERYADPHVSFEVGDALHLADSVGQTWNLIASFETIEHLTDPARFIAECKRVLAPDGVFVASVPNQTQDPPGANHFHLQHFDQAAFEALLRLHFSQVTIVPQFFALTSIIDPLTYAKVGPVSINTGAASGTATVGCPEPDCFIAVCGAPQPANTIQPVLIHSRAFWERHQEVVTANAWLDTQRQSWEAEARRLSAELDRSNTQIAELEKGRQWLENERSNWEQQARELSAELDRSNTQIAELEKGRQWLENERSNWEQQARDLSGIVDRNGSYIQQLEARLAPPEPPAADVQDGAADAPHDARA